MSIFKIKENGFMSHGHEKALAFKELTFSSSSTLGPLKPKETVKNTSTYLWIKSQHEEAHLNSFLPL